MWHFVFTVCVKIIVRCWKRVVVGSMWSQYFVHHSGLNDYWMATCVCRDWLSDPAGLMFSLMFPALSFLKALYCWNCWNIIFIYSVFCFSLLLIHSICYHSVFHFFNSWARENKILLLAMQKICLKCKPLETRCKQISTGIWCFQQCYILSSCLR